MEQSNTHSILTSHITNLLNHGQRKDQVIGQLLNEGHEEYFARQIVEQVAKLRSKKLTAQGLTLILIGAATCLLSCILALTSTGNFHLVMYGMTSVGVIVVFAGLTKVF